MAVGKKLEGKRVYSRVSCVMVASLVFDNPNTEVPVRAIKEGVVLLGSLLDISSQGAGFVCKGAVGISSEWALIIDFCDIKVACKVSVRYVKSMFELSYVGVEFIDLDLRYQEFIDGILSNAMGAV